MMLLHNYGEGGVLSHTYIYGCVPLRQYHYPTQKKVFTMRQGGFNNCVGVKFHEYLFGHKFTIR